MINKTNKLVLFCSGDVGLKAISIVMDLHPNNLAGLVIDINTRQYYDQLPEVPVLIFSKGDDKKLLSFLETFDFDMTILAWWPHILKEEVINIPSNGTLNFHPSLLPYNRGKHYNFWNIVEDVPFGVTIHKVDTGIDSGAIVFQQVINKNWEDNGKTLYEKAQVTIIELFRNCLSNLINNEFELIKQDVARGSFHQAKELEPASEIKLDKAYTARSLLNLLRARTFSPHPACYFYDGTEKFEIRIEIKKI